MASKPVPLAKRFAEMLREEQAGAAPAGPSEDPLDVLIGHGGRAKEKERLEYLADNGRYLEKKEAKAKLDAMAAADERAKYEQAKRALPKMTDAQLNAVDVSTLSSGDKKAYQEEERRRKSKYEARIAAAEVELEDIEPVDPDEGNALPEGQQSFVISPLTGEWEEFDSLVMDGSADEEEGWWAA